MSVDLALAGAGLAVWLYLLLARGGFWRANIRDEADLAPVPAAWPAIAAVIPARNEADVIPASLPGLLTQDYPGPLTAVLIDDQSGDGTARVARSTADALGASSRLTVLQ